jgi:hypothetical protein
MRRVIGFPHPVNEKAARVVAGGVALLSLLILVTGWRWLLVVLAYGFWARVLTGPTLSPLGRFATAVAAPRLGAPRYVAGPPKRFAQAIGAGVTTVAALCALVLGAPTVADALTVAMVAFATLESVFAFCVGCKIFAVLMSVGVVPDAVCAECADIWA